jgi:hypothetical protein
MLWCSFAQRKLLGLVFGCLVVGIMIFMMVAILGGLFAGNQ